MATMVDSPTNPARREPTPRVAPCTLGTRTQRAFVCYSSAEAQRTKTQPKPRKGVGDRWGRTIAFEIRLLAVHLINIPPGWESALGPSPGPETPTPAPGLSSASAAGRAHLPARPPCACSIPPLLPVECSFPIDGVPGEWGSLRTRATPLLTPLPFSPCSCPPHHSGCSVLTVCGWA